MATLLQSLSVQSHCCSSLLCVCVYQTSYSLPSIIIFTFIMTNIWHQNPIQFRFGHNQNSQLNKGGDIQGFQLWGSLPESAWIISTLFYFLARMRSPCLDSPWGLEWLEYHSGLLLRTQSEKSSRGKTLEPCPWVKQLVILELCSCFIKEETKRRSERGLWKERG